jgi:hypothetical protein
MPRLISLTDAKKRDAQVSAQWPKRTDVVRNVAADGATLKMERLIRTTDTGTLDAIVKRAGGIENVAASLVASDPEIDLEQLGRPLRDASRVYIRRDGSVLFASRVMQVVYAADGTEKERRDFVDVEATVTEESPALPWTGRLMNMDEVVRKFAMVRKLQLRHVNGLTFDFLMDMAKALEETGKLLYVGAGAKGQLPLIFSANGAPFRGFLEGRTQGESYKLVLHLSNLEIKPPAPTGGAA